MDATTPGGISRSLPSDSLMRGGEFSVTINNVGLADGFGEVMETLHAGFSYVQDSADSPTANAAINAAVADQTVTFTLVADGVVHLQGYCGVRRGRWSAFLLWCLG